MTIKVIASDKINLDWFQFIIRWNNSIFTEGKDEQDSI